MRTIGSREVEASLARLPLASCCVAPPTLPLFPRFMGDNFSTDGAQAGGRGVAQLCGRSLTGCGAVLFHGPGLGDCSVGAPLQDVH